MIFRNLTFLLLLVVIMFAGLTGCVVEKASEPKILLDEHHTENKVDIENNTGDGFVVFEEYRGFYSQRDAKRHHAIIRRK